MEEIEARGGGVTDLKGAQLEGGALGCELGGMAPEPSFPEPLYHGALWPTSGLHHNEQKQAQWLRAQHLETGCQRSNPGSTTYELCDAGQVIAPLCSFLSVRC